AGYTAVTVVVGIVLWWCVALVAGGIMGSMALGGLAAGTLSAPSVESSGSFDKNSTLGKMDAWAKSMEEASKKMDAAQKSGNADAQGQAVAQMMGAVLGGSGGAAEALAPDRLKAFVPDSLGGMPRTEVSAERNGVMGIQVATANGQYSDGSGR